jgi:HEXXH motif-containing protein
MTVRLDAVAVAALAAPTGPADPVVRALFDGRRAQTIAGLRYLADRLGAEAPDLVGHTGLAESIAALAATSSAAQERVFAHPASAFWIDVAWDLIRRQAHRRHPEMHVRAHLEDLGRFALAAVYADGRGRVSRTVLTDAVGGFALPGTDCYVQADAPPYSPVRVEVADGTLNLKTTEVLRLPSGLRFDYFDRDLRLAGRTANTYAEPDPAAAASWLERLQLAWSTVDEGTPDLAAEMRLGLHTIVPVVSASPDVHLSASFSEAPGLVAMSYGATGLLAEALVHEYHHQKLNALMILDPLVAGPSSAAVYYSPWRPDPRPLTGLLHAVYTFANILGYYLDLLDRPLATMGGDEIGRAGERAHLIAGQVDAGLAELDEHARLTAFGQALVDAVAIRAGQLRERLPVIGDEALFALSRRRQEHRTQWDARHGVDTAAKRSTVDFDAVVLSDVERSVLTALGVEAPRLWATDGYLERVRALMVDGAGAALFDLVRAVPVGDSLVVDLIGGHVTYAARDYEAATARYAACLRREPGRRNLWQYYAFALRHQGQWEASTLILTNTDELVGVVAARGGDPEDVALEWLARRMADGPVLAEPSSIEPRADEDEPPALHGLGRFARYPLLVPGAAQFPSFVAVAVGLKPAMDIWLPPENLPGLREFCASLGIVMHVDAYFDRDSAQLAGVDPDLFTTTRAAFATGPGPGCQAHVFVAGTEPALREVVASGWYPLVVQGRVVPKHQLDHDVFGVALGYPACCRQFFRERNNWRVDNTYYAALRNTPGPARALSNPFLRHTVHGLVPHMPCSYDCAATIAYARAVREVLGRETPKLAVAVDRALTGHVLALSELRIYRLLRGRDTDNGVTYHAVQHLYGAGGRDDELHRLLAEGDRCRVEGTIVRVYRDSTLVGAYNARGDRHGPECPFLIRFE